jgi:L-lactate dehydrogenase complex protein LldE
LWYKTGKEVTVRLRLFIPCFMDQLAPEVAGAVSGLLARLGASWDYPRDQTCCGQFAFTAGDPGTARRLMRHFLRVFGGDGTVLCPGASCTFMVRHGYPQLAEGDREAQEVAALGARVVELSEWLAGVGPFPWTPRFQGSLVLHRSCKARQLNLLAGAARVLSRVKGLTLREVSPYYACCGFGGTFRVQHPDLSREMGETYLEAVRETGARGLVSLDSSCLLHLKSGAAGRGWDLEFFHLAEILIGP